MNALHTLGPLLEKLGNGGKGIGWNTEHEVDFLKKLNGEKAWARQNRNGY
jgi:nitrate reductase alpha subunit